MTTKPANPEPEHPAPNDKPPKSFKPEVIADSSGKFCGNALAFATREEAEANVADLAARWYLVSNTRVVESDQPVNYSYINGVLKGV